MEKLVKNTGPYFSDKMYFCKIWQSHEPARLGVIFYVPLWNLAGNLAAMWQRCLPNFGVIGKFHYNDVIMSAMASQITGISVVCSTVGLGADQRKHQRFTSLAFVWGIRWPVNSPHKRPVTRKIFPFDDVIMFKCLSHPSSKILQSYHDDGIKWKPFSALLALCAENSPVTGEFHSQRPVRRSFDVLFALRLNKRFSKQSWGWQFEPTSCSLWRHWDVLLSFTVISDV